MGMPGETTMRDEELDLARSMIRLYGGDAENVAAGHAETHADLGDEAKSERWRRIALAVAKLRGQIRPN